MLYGQVSLYSNQYSSAQHARVYIDLYVALGYISTFIYIYSHKIVQLGVYMCLLCILAETARLRRASTVMVHR